MRAWLDFDHDDREHVNEHEHVYALNDDRSELHPRGEVPEHEHNDHDNFNESADV